jgi:ABC-2 type transport system ATP-binding protein
MATVAGFDVATEPEKFRELIGVALQDTGIDPVLTGRELLIMQDLFLDLVGMIP